MQTDAASSGPAGSVFPGLVEIRTYALVPGHGGAFGELMTAGSVPMLERAGINVLFHGPAEQAPDRYILVRGFRDEADRASSLDAFYSSPEWVERMEGPIMALIDSYHVVAVSFRPEWASFFTGAAATRSD